MSAIQHSPGIEWVMFRLGAGVKPLSPYWTSDQHTAPGRDGFPGGALERDPGDYQGRRRIDDAQVGSVIVARFHNAPARLVEITRPAVPA